MKTFSWNHDKNKRLQQERGISFEEAAFHIKNGGVLAVIAHPNQAKYQNQWFYVVAINNYAYVIPFVDNEKEIFLKTIFPSRKYTKLYLNRED